MAKITFKNLKKINSLYNKLALNESFANTKLAYAFKRFADINFGKIFGDYNTEIESILIDNALTDNDTGAVLYETENAKGVKDFKFSKEGLKKVSSQKRALEDEWDKREFEVTAYICKDWKGFKLEEDEIKILKDYII